MTYSATILLCRRDARGVIVALAREPQGSEAARAEGWEPVRADDPDVNHFILGIANPPTHLSLSDAGMGRVTEDLINVLIDRGVMAFTDLPHAAQARLLARRTSRSELANRLSLVPQEPDDTVL